MKARHGESNHTTNFISHVPAGALFTTSRSNTTTTWPWSLLPVSVSRILRASRLPVSFACGVCKVPVGIDGILKQRVIGFVAIDCRVGLFAVAMRDRKLRRDEV